MLRMHKFLHNLNYLLKYDLGFRGFVFLGWGAQHSGVSSALAGLEMKMPGDTFPLSGASCLGRGESYRCNTQWYHATATPGRRGYGDHGRLLRDWW